MVSKSDLQNVDPYRLERIVGELWEAKGWDTLIRSKTSDRGIDIDASRGGVTEKIQVKRYSNGNKVGSSDVRNYATLYQQTDANNVVIVTTGQFTKPARSLADDLDVEVMNGRKLARELDRNDISVPTSSQTNTPNFQILSDIFGSLYPILMLLILVLIAIGGQILVASLFSVI
ncbi:restriction endonuclease [Halorubrum ezzemoulense]|uniref:Restriction endonuclease type IV Mrr domain-containing protein n=1 Tax=Halorubrum ezzemoulense TaxID=337243 RepID=A0A256JC27_HALEZ|nr:restriction endonuclease [Halorubrum ezzemoulense]OYR65877.1 hypothetical protein DJ80_01020 [Halorubrum ezzemoulense]